MICGDKEMVKSRPSMATGFAVLCSSLSVMASPRSEAPTQVALLLDSNFNQRNVLALEQQMAAELISLFEKENAQALVMNYRAQIHSSGELTDDWRSFTSMCRANALNV